MVPWKKKEEPKEDNGVPEGILLESEFKINAKQLSDFVDSRDDNWKDLFGEYGRLEGLAELMQTNLENGIPEVDAAVERRKEVFGKNELPKKETESFLSMFIGALSDKTLIVLCVASVVSIILGVAFEDRKTGWIEGTAILIAVLIVATVTSGNDYSKERRFRKLNDIVSDRKISVVRKGVSIQTSIYDVVVGDLVLLEAGNFVPCDGIYINGNNLKIDESSLTGESDAVKKGENNLFILGGCKVMEGKGKMIAIGVGQLSTVGKLKKILDQEADDTPLQKKLGDLAELIGKLGLVAAVILLISLLIRWIVEISTSDEDWEWEELKSLVDFIILAITIIVVAVPEGLPMAVTISLAFSMFKMMKDQNLVRKLEACETMGGATNICSDKTGTLTENKMTVVKAAFAFKDFTDVSQVGELPKSILTPLLEGICLNSSAFLTKNPETGKTEYVGSKTECALLDFSLKLGVEYNEMRKAHPLVTSYPFSSERKRMGSVIRSEAGFRFFCKGAPEIVLEYCTRHLDEDGAIVPLSALLKSALLSKIEGMAAEGLRVLCLSYSDIEQEQDWANPPEHDLTFIGLVGIKDPVRADVPHAVEVCQHAGIMVRMVTGDNPLTARHIAQECGILTENGLLMEGPQFRKLEGEALDEAISRLQVLARSSPEDKYKLVKRLRELGEVVAVTGDGTNDAPQLKEADVGFSMGIAGTEVAKEASDIVLLDDNFKSIVNAVKWGRNVYDSIRKFLQFQLTVNVCAVVLVYVGAVSSDHGESPLRPIQMLWVNLIMDTLAALALATETPNDELLERKPYGRHDRIITLRMARFIIGHSIYQLAVLFGLWYGAESIDWLVDQSLNKEDRLLVVGTLVFNSFVICQIVNEFNARKLFDEKNCFSGVFTNWIFWLIIAITVIIQFILVQFCGPVASTTGLNGIQWLSCIVLGLLELPYGVILRFIPVPEPLPKGAPVDLKKNKYKHEKVDKDDDEKALPLLEVNPQDHAHEKKDEHAAEKHDDVKPVDKERVDQLWNTARNVVKMHTVVSQFRRYRR